MDEILNDLSFILSINFKGIRYGMIEITWKRIDY